MPVPNKSTAPIKKDVPQEPLRVVNADETIKSVATKMHTSDALTNAKTRDSLTVQMAGVMQEFSGDYTQYKRKVAVLAPVMWGLWKAYEKDNLSTASQIGWMKQFFPFCKGLPDGQKACQTYRDKDGNMPYNMFQYLFRQARTIEENQKLIDTKRTEIEDRRKLLTAGTTTDGKLLTDEQKKTESAAIENVEKLLKTADASETSSIPKTGGAAQPQRGKADEGLEGDLKANFATFATKLTELCTKYDVHSVKPLVVATVEQPGAFVIDPVNTDVFKALVTALIRDAMTKSLHDYLGKKNIPTDAKSQFQRILAKVFPPANTTPAPKAS